MTAKLITLLVSLLFCLLFLEGAARVLHGTSLRKPRIAHFEGRTRRWCCAGQGLDYTYKPNIEFKHCYDGRGAGNLESDDCITYRTNSWGYRDIEHARRKEPDRYRIVILGDSFTVGEDTRFDEIYPRRPGGVARAPSARGQARRGGQSGDSRRRHIERDANLS